MRRLMVAGFGGLLIVLVAVPVAFALLTPVGVRTTPAGEGWPAAQGSVFGWSQNSASNPNWFNAYVKDGPNPRVKANRRGFALSGGFDGNIFVFQRDFRNNSNIVFFNMVTKTRTGAPVNTADNDEISPTLSNGWLLFGREGEDEQLNFVSRVLLHSLITHETRVLETHTDLPLQPGQVNGDFAVWGGLTPTGNQTVRRYRISTKTTTTLPQPTGKYDYSPAVASDGRVFYVRSGPGCGNEVEIREWAPAPASIDTTLVKLPGHDIFNSMYFDESTSTLYYDPFNCSAPDWRASLDIYKIVIP